MRNTVSGACSGALSTTVLPAASADAVLPATCSGGQLNGRMAPTTPYGSYTVYTSSGPWRSESPAILSARPPK